MRDTLTNEIRRSEYGIGNENSEMGPGTHWIEDITYFNNVQFFFILVFYFVSYLNLPPHLKL